jgi:hypothetical protein
MACLTISVDVPPLTTRTTAAAASGTKNLRFDLSFHCGIKEIVKLAFHLLRSRIFQEIIEGIAGAISGRGRLLLGHIGAVDLEQDCRLKTNKQISAAVVWLFE